MIAVVNISRNYSRVGKQRYEVRFNEIPLATFSHNTEEGMSVCLEKAAKALEGVDIDQRIRDYEITRIYKMIKEEGY